VREAARVHGDAGGAHAGAAREAPAAKAKPKKWVWRKRQLELHTLALIRKPVVAVVCVALPFWLAPVASSPCPCCSLV